MSYSHINVALARKLLLVDGSFMTHCTSSSTDIPKLLNRSNGDKLKRLAWSYAWGELDRNIVNSSAANKALKARFDYIMTCTFAGALSHRMSGQTSLTHWQLLPFRFS